MEIVSAGDYIIPYRKSMSHTWMVAWLFVIPNVTCSVQVRALQGIVRIHKSTSKNIEDR